jgi:hypothetical protein
MNCGVLCSHSCIDHKTDFLHKDWGVAWADLRRMEAFRRMSSRDIALLLADRAAGVEKSKSSPQRLKPDTYCSAFGMTEVMP